MNIGNGSLGITSPESVSGSPFVAGSANNGLSVDTTTGKIVLGDDTGAGGPAALLSNRLIDLAGFFVAFIGAFGEVDISPSNITISGDESNAATPLESFVDVNTADTGSVQLVNSQNEFQFAFNDSTGGGNTTGIGSSRNYVRVSKSLNAANVDSGALLQIDADMTTGDPGSGKGKWKLGKKIAAAVVLDNANYIEVDIDGVVYKLALVN